MSLDLELQKKLGTRNFRLLRSGMGLLYRAFRYARDLEVDAWQLAVTIGELRRAELYKTDLRWYLRQGLVETKQEIAPRGETRRFEKTAAAALTEKSCFVLTPRGVEWAAGLPFWNAAQRELWVGPTLVRRFRRPAANQELILSALEEEGWPRRIDDPLPLVDDIEPKQRLHDTLKFLNRYQLVPRILFRGDGSGEGVTWEILAVKAKG